MMTLEETSNKFAQLTSITTGANHIVLFSKKRDTWTLLFIQHSITLRAPTLQKLFADGIAWIKAHSVERRIVI